MRTLLLAVVVLPAALAEAHPGGTDADGCHTCRTECAQWAPHHCHTGARKATSWAPERSWARATVFVESVIDGDTIKVRTRDEPPQRYTVRLRGIDCPERKEAGGRDATAHTRARLTGLTIVLQAGATEFERDVFGRTLAYAEYMGVDIGLELIERRLCADYSYKYPHARQERYGRAAAAQVAPTAGSR